MLELSHLVWLSIFVFAFWYWWKAKEFKEFANQSLKQYCRRVDVELLDDTLYLKAVRLKRDEGGALRVWRRFEFEFSSTGDERYQGQLIMLGRKIARIELDAHRFPS